MFWVLAFVAVGGTYTAVDRAPTGLLAAFAAALIIMPPIAWVNNTFGIEMFIIDSYQFLSGVDTMNDVIGECVNVTTRNFWGLLLLPVAVINAVPGVGAVIGIPVGAIVTLTGVVWFVSGQGQEVFKSGLVILTGGLGCVIAAGLIMRFLAWASTGPTCSYW